MRDRAEAEHAVAIGADPARIKVTGNTKFDASRQEEKMPAAEREKLTADLGIYGAGPVWLAGSTHEGEETVLLDVFKSLRVATPELRLIIAPRYIERAERVLSLVRERGLTVALRSVGADQEAVVVLDTVGELREAYSMATVVFVGGSLVSRGGHNILEPAACGKPVLFGPHMENFRASSRVLVGRGGIQVPDGDRLLRVMTDLLSRPDEMAKLGSMAREAVTSVQGASQACAQVIVAAVRKGQRP